MVNYEFLFWVLRKLGFSHSWCKWNHSFIFKENFLVLIIGSLLCIFSSSQGVHQWDHVSPFLFVLLVDGLSRSRNAVKHIISLKYIKLTSVPYSFYHHLFVDGTLLIGRASTEEALVMKKILTNYLTTSKKVLNKDKSNLFLFNMSPLV